MKHHARTLLVIILAGFFVQVLPHTVWAIPSFQSPEPLSINNGVARLPSALHLANGGLWVAWQSTSLPGHTTIYYDTYNGTWSGAHTFITGPGSIANLSPALAQFQNGTIILFWTSNQTGHYNLYSELYRGSSWSIRNSVTSTASDDYLPKVVIGTDGTLWVFWERDSSSSSCINSLCRQIYYKTLKGNQWSNDTGLTMNSAWSSMPDAVSTADGRIWLSWSSETSSGTGFNILYSLYNGQWSNAVQLTISPTSDTHPAFVVDRNGTVWLFFSRDVVLTSGQNGVDESDLFYLYSTNVGSTWIGPTQLTQGGTASNPIDSTDPAPVQASDEMLYVFYSTTLASGSSYDMFYVRSNAILTHHVAVTGLQYPPFQYPGGMDSVGESSIEKLNVTISNLGDYGENIVVTASISNATTYKLANITAALVAGSSATYTFKWNTTGVKPARYTLSATVSPVVPDEPLLNTYNNNAVAGDVIKIVPYGDVDQDGSVTITDVSIIFYDFGFASSCNCSRWNPYADINNDGTIDIVDVGIVLANYDTFI